jgi:DNA ligase-associated metallophosphoesterase
MRQAWLPLGDAVLVADLSGALVWPEQSMVVVADLHLEKGSALARRGLLLPPYDTRTTLTRLEAVLARWRPRRVVSLGDGFHDGAASTRLGAEDRLRLRRLVAACDWLWLAGNHDPAPPEGLGGRVEQALEIAGITLRHAPAPQPGAREIAGHLHPCAGVEVRGRQLSRRCFVDDGRRLLLPAFGSYTGGLDVLDPAIASLFADGFQATLLGEQGVHALPHHRLLRRAARDPRRRRPAAWSGRC